MATALLHIGHYWFVPDPPESHHWFGAIFLFVGVILVIEALAGGVWFRNRLRAAIWPAVAMFLGEGLIVVAALDPADRVVHFTVGVLVLAAGWLELRYRFGQLSRFSADLFVVPALLGSGFEMGVIHGTGPPMTAFGHVSMGLIVAMMAGMRIHQARLPTSFRRHVSTGLLVIVLGLILLIFQP
jgi:hypothetical protein